MLFRTAGIIKRAVNGVHEKQYLLAQSSAF